MKKFARFAGALVAGFLMIALCSCGSGGARENYGFIELRYWGAKSVSSSYPNIIEVMPTAEDSTITLKDDWGTVVIEPEKAYAWDRGDAALYLFEEDFGLFGDFSGDEYGYMTERPKFIEITEETEEGVVAYAVIRATPKNSGGYWGAVVSSVQFDTPMPAWRVRLRMHSVESKLRGARSYYEKMGSDIPIGGWRRAGLELQYCIKWVKDLFR